MSFLTVQNLKKSYGKTIALHGIDLQIEKGAIVGLIGPDGAGKTTTMRILCGLIDPDSGTGSFETTDLFGDRRGLNARIGYMPQNFSLYPDLTVEENMRFYADLFKVRGDEFRSKRDRLYEFSQLGPFRDRRSGALSGGMKQKLALSCALMRDPDLLILDEPTTGVDPLSRRQFWELLFQLRSTGVTVLVATPYMDEAGKADLVLFLAQGKIIARGTPEEISRSYIGSVYELSRQLSNVQIEQINLQNGIRARRFGASVHVACEPNQPLIAHREILSHAGIHADELQQVSPSLEDRFLQLIQQEQSA
jgi:ABC-2 type transport system ATP-binding protein